MNIVFLIYFHYNQKNIIKQFTFNLENGQFSRKKTLSFTIIYFIDAL